MSITMRDDCGRKSIRELNFSRVFNLKWWYALINCCFILILWVLMESSFFMILLKYYRSRVGSNFTRSNIIFFCLMVVVYIYCWRLSVDFFFGNISIHVFMYIPWNFRKRNWKVTSYDTNCTSYISLYRIRWHFLSSKCFSKDLLTVLKF